MYFIFWESSPNLLLERFIFKVFTLERDRAYINSARLYILSTLAAKLDNSSERVVG